MVSAPAWAGSVVINSVKDNTFYDPAVGAAQSNGAGTYMFAGNNNGGLKRRAVLAFDIAGAVPAGAVIDSVSLRLYMSKTTAGSVPVAMHRLLADWGEGTSDAPGEEGGGGVKTPDASTWLHTFAPDQFWENAGGDFNPFASATINVTGVGFHTWASTGPLVADVQGWVDAPESNFGWILVSNELITPGAKRFNTREFSTSSFRPRLTVEFTPGTCNDQDEDGYGSPGNAVCANGPETDCNDDDTNINPGAEEVCDGMDNNCNGTADEQIVTCTVPAASAWGIVVMLLGLVAVASWVIRPDHS
ncbi:MAG: DNRLRE domain-containing protein [Planctomycetota bacterium]|jgi:hypothetical protein